MFQRNLKALIIASILLTAQSQSWGQNLFFHLLSQNSLPTFTWTGAAGDHNWNTAGNWSNNSVPGASDVAKFYGAGCSGADCNATMNVNVNVAGVNIDSAFSGTITQAAGSTITIGASGWSQAGGTFAGGNSAIAFNGSFSLSGGTHTASSNTTTFSGSVWSVSGSPTYNANSGTLVFRHTTTSVSPGPVNYANVTFTWDAWGAANLNAGTMNVGGTLKLDSYSVGCGTSCVVNNGTIAVAGNVVMTRAGGQGSAIVKLVGSSNQSVDATAGVAGVAISGLQIASTGGTVSFLGDLIISGDYTYTSGTVNTGTTTLNFSAHGMQNIVPGTVLYNNVKFEQTAWATHNLSGGTMTVNGNVEYNSIIGCGTSCVINSGTVEAKGNVNIVGDGFRGTFVTKISGNVNQTIDASAASGDGAIGELLIASTGGTVSFVGEIGVTRNYTFSSGTLNAGTSTLLFRDGNNQNIVAGAATYSNVKFFSPGWWGNKDLQAGTMLVGGNLELAAPPGCGSSCPINNGAFAVQGNLIITNDGAQGNASIQLVGAADTTMTAVPALRIPSGTVTVNKSLLSAKVTLLGSAAISSAGQDLNVTQGTVDMNGFNLSINDVLSVSSSGSVICNGGTLTAGSVANGGFIICPGYGEIWTGLAGDNNWNTPGNWSGGAAPTAAEMAYFLAANCTGANCNATVNVPINVKGIYLDSTFSGTVTQGAGNSITIGSSGWTQASGTFTGGNASITILGSHLVMGGTFSSTSNVLAVQQNVTLANAATFSHNNGTYTLGGCAGGGTTMTAPSKSFYNLSHNRQACGDITFSDTITVQNNLDMATGSAFVGSGVIQVYGNVSASSIYLFSNSPLLVKLMGSSNQTVTGTDPGPGIYGGLNGLEINKSGGTVTFTGTIVLSSDFKYTAGTVDATNAYFIFRGCAPGAIIPGPIVFKDVDLGIDYCYVHSITGTIRATGNVNIGTSMHSGGTVEVGGNLGVYVSSGTSTTSVLLNGTGNQTVSIAVANNPFLQNVSVSKASGTVSFSTNVPLDNSGENLTISAGTVDMNGKNLTVNGTLTVAAGATLMCNGGSLSYGSLINNGTIDCPGIGFNWTGLAGDGNFNTPGNWSANAVPGASDVAVFGSACAGAACNATLNVSKSLKGISFVNSYAGTFTQAAGNTLTIGTSGWTQTSGTFTGGNSAITVNGNFGLSGGIFTSTSGTLTANSNWSVTGSPTINHSSGTINFYGPPTVVAGTSAYNNVVFGGCFVTTTISDTMTIDGALDLAGACGYLGLNGGTILAKGNVTASNAGARGTTLLKVNGSGNQTITSSISAYFPNFEVASTGGTVSYVGNLNFPQNYTYTSGTVSTGISTVIFGINAASLVPGPVTYYGATFSKCYDTITMTGTMTVNGPLTLSGACGMQIINSGTIVAGGDVTFSGAGTNGNVLIKIAGSGNQTVTGLALANVPNLEIASTGGTVTLAGTLEMQQGLTYTSGVVNAGTSTLNFGGVGTSNVNPGVATYGNVKFTKCGGLVNISSAFGVAGTLTVAGACGGQTVNGSDILASGNIDLDRGLGGTDGTSLLKIMGSGNQTLAGVGSGGSYGNIEIASTGGTVTLAGTIEADRNFTYTSGTVSAGTSTLLLGGMGGTTLNTGSMNFGNLTLSKCLGTITVVGSVNVDGTLSIAAACGTQTVNGGTILANGNVIINSGSNSGTTALSFVGSTAGTTLSNSGGSIMTGAVTVNKTGAGSVVLTTNISFPGAAQDLTITAGTLEMSGFNLNIGRNITNSGTLKRGNNPSCGTLTQGGSYSGSAPICP